MALDRIEFNSPYIKPSDPNEIRDDACQLFHGMSYDDLVNLASTYFPSDLLAELIDDHMMGRV